MLLQDLLTVIKKRILINQQNHGTSYGNATMAFCLQCDNDLTSCHLVNNFADYDTASKQ